MGSVIFFLASFRDFISRSLEYWDHQVREIKSRIRSRSKITNRCFCSTTFARYKITGKLRDLISQDFSPCSKIKLATNWRSDTACKKNLYSITKCFNKEAYKSIFHCWNEHGSHENSFHISINHLWISYMVTNWCVYLKLVNFQTASREIWLEWVIRRLYPWSINFLVI